MREIGISNKAKRLIFSDIFGSRIYHADSNSDEDSAPSTTNEGGLVNCWTEDEFDES